LPSSVVPTLRHRLSLGTTERNLKERQDIPRRWRLSYKRDLPEVEFHLIDTGHFALEDKADEMVPLIRDFLGRKVK
jgi:hypothetical protein